MDVGLARRNRQASPQGIQHTRSRHQAPRTNEQGSPRKKSPTLGSVAAICQAWCEPIAPRYRRPILELAKLAGNCTPHQLTPLHFQALVASWRHRLHRSTVYAYRARLKNLVVHIAALTNRPDLIGQIPKVPSPQPRKQIASPKELEALLLMAPPHIRCAILLAAHAGFRASDVLRIAPVHYNAENKTISIEQKKTGRTITVPASNPLAVMLEGAPQADSPLTPFVTLYHHRPVTYNALNIAFTKLKKKAGADAGLNFHDLRRTIAVSLYEVSKDLRVVEQMLGHQSLSSTMHYLEHRDPAKLRPYLDALFIPKGTVQ